MLPSVLLIDHIRKNVDNDLFNKTPTISNEWTATQIIDRSD